MPMTYVIGRVLSSNLVGFVSVELRGQRVHSYVETDVEGFGGVLPSLDDEFVSKQLDHFSFEVLLHFFDNVEAIF